MRQRFLEFVKQQPLELIDSLDMRMVAHIVGIEKMLELIDAFGGTAVTFPKYVFRRLARRYVEANLEQPTRQLAYDTGLSEAVIRRWKAEARRSIGDADE